MYNPSKYWDEIGRMSSAGSGEVSGRFATDATGTSFYQLPKWTTQPQFWEYIQGNSRVLDIGSGNGLQIGRLTQRGVFAVGCDVSLALLKVAKHNMISHGVDAPMLVQWDGHHMPFASNVFDRLTTNTVLQHVVDDKAVHSIFKEASRILVDDGLFIICELVSPRDIQTALHVKMRSPQTYTRMAEKYGFCIVKMRHTVSIYVAIQAAYGKTVTQADVPPVGSNTDNIYTIKAQYSNCLAFLAKRILRRLVAELAKVVDPLITILRLGHKFPGKDEFVFRRQNDILLNYSK